MVWHVLTLGAMVTCGLLAAWQWGKAGTAMGSALNVGYGLQWPVFAVFFGVMWWRMLRMELRQLRAGAPDPAPTAEAVPAPAPAGPEEENAGPSPFAFRSRAAAEANRDADPELAAYNRMLAQLAARDREN
jgi:DNA-binding transcriptional regulator of glucitol operon